MKEFLLVFLMFMSIGLLGRDQELKEELDTVRMEIYHLQPHTSWLDHIRKISPPRAACTVND